jgi:hypothetical protein
METTIQEFTFNDFCQRCQRVMEHKIIIEGKMLEGKCLTCGLNRPITEADQVYYSNTDLWVTRFKIGNLPNVVTGKLFETIRQLEIE